MEKDTNSNSNGNNNTRHPKIISFFVNNITDYNYSMQLITKMMKLIKNLLGFKRTKCNQRNSSNSKSDSKHLKFYQFFINNRSGHSEQVTIDIEIIQNI